MLHNGNELLIQTKTTTNLKIPIILRKRIYMWTNVGAGGSDWLQEVSGNIPGDGNTLHLVLVGRYMWVYSYQVLWKWTVKFCAFYVIQIILQLNLIMKKLISLIGKTSITQNICLFIYIEIFFRFMLLKFCL